VALELWVVGAVHALVASASCWRGAPAHQRAADLKRFLELKAG
jgi:hypothetical protein